MNHSAVQSNLSRYYYLHTYLFASLLLSLLFNVTNAASQGTLGKSSSASVEISITVNQSLRAVSPTELMLNSTNASKPTSKPFCIAHHGFKNNSSVPYELVVDNLVSGNKDQQNPLPYKIYLEDKDENKQLLNNGTKVARQSTLNLSEEVVEQCSENGLRISIEEYNNTKNDVFSRTTAGLMILLVSPN